MEHPINPQPQQVEEGNNPSAISRRHLLKLLAATGGAVAASTLLPGKWAKPVVEVGMLAAHAQLSEPEIPDTIVQLTWPIYIEARDLDLRSVGNGATVDESNPNSPTMAWAYEEIPPQQPIGFSETITIISADSSGNYEIYVFQDEWDARSANRQLQGAILSITLPNEPAVSKDITNELMPGQWVHCATINFDTFSLTWHV